MRIASGCAHCSYPLADEYVGTCKNCGKTLCSDCTKHPENQKHCEKRQGADLTKILEAINPKKQS